MPMITIRLAIPDEDTFEGGLCVSGPVIGEHLARYLPTLEQSGGLSITVDGTLTLEPGPAPDATGTTS